MDINDLYIRISQLQNAIYYVGALNVAGNLRFRETIDTIKYLRRFIAKKINAEVEYD